MGLASVIAFAGTASPASPSRVARAASRLMLAARPGKHQARLRRARWAWALPLVVPFLGCDSRDGPSSVSAASSGSTVAASTASVAASVAGSARLLRAFRCGYYADAPVSSFAQTFDRRTECLGERRETKGVQSLPGSWWCVATTVPFVGPAPTEPLAKVEIPGVQWLDEQRQEAPDARNGTFSDCELILVKNVAYEERLSRVVRQMRNKPSEIQALCREARATKGDPEALRAAAMDRQQRYLETGDLAVSSDLDSLLGLFKELHERCD
jgi:hypothetical protein